MRDKESVKILQRNEGSDKQGLNMIQAKIR